MEDILILKERLKDIINKIINNNDNWLMKMVKVMNVLIFIILF